MQSRNSWIQDISFIYIYIYIWRIKTSTQVLHNDWLLYFCPQMLSHFPPSMFILTKVEGNLFLSPVSGPISCCCSSLVLLDGPGSDSIPHLPWASLDSQQNLLLLSPMQACSVAAGLHHTTKSMACARVTLSTQTDRAATPGRIHFTSQPSVTLLPNSELHFSTAFMAKWGDTILIWCLGGCWILILFSCYTNWASLLLPNSLMTVETAGAWPECTEKNVLGLCGGGAWHDMTHPWAWRKERAHRRRADHKGGKTCHDYYLSLHDIPRLIVLLTY